MEPRERLTVTVRGRVQGVCFRRATQSEASRLGLDGTVRNALDGSVRVVAEGRRDRLEMLLAWLHRGPSGAHVVSVESDWSEPAGRMSGFRIIG